MTIDERNNESTDDREDRLPVADILTAREIADRIIAQAEQQLAKPDQITITRAYSQGTNWNE